MMRPDLFSRTVCPNEQRDQRANRLSGVEIAPGATGSLWKTAGYKHSKQEQKKKRGSLTTS